MSNFDAMNEIQLIEEKKHALQLCEKIPISFSVMNLCIFTIAFVARLREIEFYGDCLN